VNNWGNTERIYPSGGLTSGCSRIATAPFFKYFLLAVLVYNVTCRAHPQSAEPRALGRTEQNL